MGLSWSKNPKSNAGVGLATGRASHVTQVKGNDPDQKGYPGPPGWGLGVGLLITSLKKYVLSRSF